MGKVGPSLSESFSNPEKVFRKSEGSKRYPKKNLGALSYYFVYGRYRIQLDELGDHSVHRPC